MFSGYNDKKLRERDYIARNPRYYYFLCLCLSVSLCFCVSISLSLFLLHLSLSFCLNVFVSLSLCLSVSLSLSLSLSLSHTHTHAHICIQTYLMNLRSFFGGYGFSICLCHISEKTLDTLNESAASIVCLVACPATCVTLKSRITPTDYTLPLLLIEIVVTSFQL